MIRIDKLNGIIAERGYSKARLAKAIGITPKTFYEKTKKGVFGSDEIEAMIEVLHIEDPGSIFFAAQ